MRWAFKVCEELGIDDPPGWMDAVPATLLDWWIAYYALKHDESSEAKPASEFAGGLNIGQRSDRQS